MKLRLNYIFKLRFFCPTGEDAAEESEEVDSAVDPYDLMDAVDIIPLMSKDFYEQIVRLYLFVCLFIYLFI